MTGHAVDNLSLSKGGHHRRTLLTLGVGGLAASLSGVSPGCAKQGSGKKRKQQCRRMKRSCANKVQNYCAGFGDDASACEDDLLHCCDKCDLGAGIICVMEGITILQ